MVAAKIIRTCVECGATKRTSPFYCSRRCVYEARVRDAPRRFFERVEKTEACWLWRGPFNPGGYGKFWSRSKTLGAHRYAYGLLNGPIPKGLSVLHRCDRPACVNPAHLFLGTDADNVRDKWAKGRGPSGDRSGSRTHPESIRRGEDQGGAKLTETDVRTIRTARAAGATCAALGRRFQMTPEGISAVCRRKTWKHVT
jgi:hypothetical protein